MPPSYSISLQQGAVPSPSSPKSPSSSPLTTTGVNPSQIHVSNIPLGRGSFGSVWRGTFAGSPVAIKICDAYQRHGLNNSAARSAAIQFRRETNRYQHLRHPCITQFFCVVEDPNTTKLLLVTELMAGGSLYDAISKLREARIARLPSSSLLNIAQHITSGLAYLHAFGFSFGDLKSMNVLLSQPPDIQNGTFSSNTQAKLCDFGLSRNLKHLVVSSNNKQSKSINNSQTSNPSKNGPAGTFAYLAPEAFSGLPPDDPEAPKQADIFALAIVLWELATLDRPWPGRQALQLIKLVKKEGKRPPWPTVLRGLPDGYVDLVNQCWHQDPLQRPTVEQVAQRLQQMIDALPSQQSSSFSSYKSLSSRHESILLTPTTNEYKQDEDDILANEFDAIPVEDGEALRTPTPGYASPRRRSRLLRKESSVIVVGNEISENEAFPESNVVEDHVHDDDNLAVIKHVETMRPVTDSLPKLEYQFIEEEELEPHGEASMSDVTIVRQESTHSQSIISFDSISRCDSLRSSESRKPFVRNDARRYSESCVTPPKNVSNISARASLPLIRRKDAQPMRDHLRQFPTRPDYPSPISSQNDHTNESQLRSRRYSLPRNNASPQLSPPPSTNWGYHASVASESHAKLQSSSHNSGEIRASQNYPTPAQNDSRPKPYYPMNVNVDTQPKPYYPASIQSEVQKHSYYPTASNGSPAPPKYLPPTYNENSRSLYPPTSPSKWQSESIYPSASNSNWHSNNYYRPDYPPPSSRTEFYARPDYPPPSRSNRKGHTVSGEYPALSSGEYNRGLSRSDSHMSCDSLSGKTLRVACGAPLRQLDMMSNEVKHYSVPDGDTSGSSILDDELKELEDADSLNFSNVGISMFTRPHFR